MFGEERHILIHRKQISEQNLKPVKEGEPSFDESVYVAPYSVKCLSIEAEILKISGIEFQKKCLKESVTEGLFINNLRKKQLIAK